MQRILLGLVLVLSPWLFLAGPDYHAPRSWQLGWQLGHVVLFFAAAGWWLRGRGGRRGWWIGSTAVLAGAVVAGGLIEALQYYTHRDASWSDLRLDACGAALAGGLLHPAAAGHRLARIGLVAVPAVLLLVLDIRPLAIAGVDEYNAWRAFPLLSDFETPFELGRWQADGAIRVVEDGERDSHVLALKLVPARYSGFRLLHFPRDWRGFRAVEISVHAGADTPGSLSCRINDIAHDTDNRFADRINRRFELVPGWNRLSIPLAEVRSAPQGRFMDMGRVAALGCFFVDLKVPAEVRIDDVGLTGIDD